MKKKGKERKGKKEGQKRKGSRTNHGLATQTRSRVSELAVIYLLFPEESNYSIKYSD